MRRRFDIRRYIYILVFFTVVLYVLSTFVAPKGGLSFMTVLGGLLFLAANAVLVYLTVDFFAVSINHAAPFVFAILALSFPAVALYDPSLWCALPLNLAFYLAARFYGGDINEDWAFCYSALIAIASMLFPPVAWVALFLLIMNFFPAGDKPRFIVISLAGFLFPLVVFLAYKFATVDVRELGPMAKQYLGGMVAPYVDLGANTAARVIKIATFIICFIVSLVSFFKRSAEYSVSHSKVMIFIFAYSAMMTLLLFLFGYGTLQMNTMLLLAPVSLVIYDYLIWGASDRDCRIAISFLSLAVLLEYIFVVIR